MLRFIKRFLKADAGSNALEYGLIIAFVSLAVIGGASTAGTALGTLFTDLGTELTTVAASI